MDRRDFIKQVLLWSAGISTSIPSFRIGSELLAAEKAPPVVSHAKGKNYYDLVARVLEPLGGIGKYVKTGDETAVRTRLPTRTPWWSRHWLNILLMPVRKRSWYSTVPAMNKDGAM